MSFASSQCCLEQELEGKVLANLKSSLFSCLTRSHLSYGLVGGVLTPRTHSSSYWHMNKVILIIITIIYYYFLSWLNTYWVSLCSEQASLVWTLGFGMNAGCFFFCFFVFLSNWKHNSKLQWFTIVTLIFITIAAVWKHGFRSLVCKCLFPYNPRWSGTHIRYLTCETHVTLADDLAALEHYSCLVTLKPRNISDLLGLGLNILCWPMRILILQGGKKKKSKTMEMCHSVC